MDATKPRLGRGLDALLGDAAHPNARDANRLPLDQIRHNPYQPRKRFDSDELNALSDSIKNHGVLQPLVVRKTSDGFQLVAGERRLKAAEQAGLKDVPVHIVDFNDQQTHEAALVENIQRTDLNAIEKAQGFKDYLDRYALTHDQLGAKLGLDRSTISNLLGLLNLPQEVQDAVRVGQITLGHAKVIKGVNSAAKQIALCKEVILSGMSVHALEQSVKESRQAAKAAGAAPAKEPVPHLVSLENDLRQKLACRVEFKLKAKDAGQIIIGFETNDDFERVLAMLNR
jgi:ParB family transcriptional regulator, chromosome partitioning protein